MGKEECGPQECLHLHQQLLSKSVCNPNWTATAPEWYVQITALILSTTSSHSMEFRSSLSWILNQTRNFWMGIVGKHTRWSQLCLQTHSNRVLHIMVAIYCGHEASVILIQELQRVFCIVMMVMEGL